MKRVLGFALALVLLSAASALAHDHIDSGEGHVVYSGYVAPTEDHDGSTGEGTCSVCGAVVEPATRIPKLESQRKENKAPDPTPKSAPKAQKPTAPPAAPKQTPKPSSGGTSSGSTGQEPTRVPEPADGGETAATRRPKSPKSTPTPQPDLRYVPEGADSGGNASLGDRGPSSGSPSAGKPSSGKPSAAKGPVRDLKLYPVFSDRFPWRRLRMEPAAGIGVNLAGRLLWPLPDAASPLMVLMQ